MILLGKRRMIMKDIMRKHNSAIKRYQILAGNKAASLSSVSSGEYLF
jgi:hypothetical protein